MGRANYTFRDKAEGTGKGGVHPIWRGIGFIILVGLTVGAFYLAGYLLEMHWRTPFPWVPFPIPRNFTVQLHPWLPVWPGKVLVQLGAALLIDLLGYALMVMVYAIINPIRPGKTDAPQPRRRGRGSMVR
jgi:hypothetical protein